MTKDVTSTLQDVEKKLTDDWVMSSVKGAFKTKVWVNNLSVIGVVEMVDH